MDPRPICSGRLAAPLIEQFDEGDQVDESLKAAHTELVAQEVGFGAMSAALLKQVIVALLRLARFARWISGSSAFRC